MSPITIVTLYEVSSPREAQLALSLKGINLGEFANSHRPINVQSQLWKLRATVFI